MDKKIEAVLRISAKQGSMAALEKTAAKLEQIDRKAKILNRTQTVLGRTQAALGRTMSAIPVGKVLGGAALAYGAKEAYTHFADVERSLTRTGIKLGASREQMTDMMAEMSQIAHKYAVPIADVQNAFDTLAESGNDFATSKSMLESMVKATQGMGGAAEDTVATFDAARKSFGLATKDAEKFFDVVAAGGAMGKFEGSDLARYLPSLMPTAARQGYSGLEGSARLVAALEVMRDFVGTSEEANTATADFFDKIASEDVQDRFKEIAKIDLEKRLARARKEGEDVLQVMHDVIKEATKGDASKLSKLFGDRDSRRFADMLLKNIDRVNDAWDHLMKKSGGTIQANVNLVTTNAKAELDRLEIQWERFKTSVGSRLSVVISPVLENINNALDDDAAYGEGLKRNQRRDGLDELESFKRFKKRFDDEKRLGDARQKFIEAIRALGRGEIGSISDFFDPKKRRRGPPGAVDEQRAEQRDNRPQPRQALPKAFPLPPTDRAGALAANEADRQRLEDERKRREALAKEYKHGTGRERVAEAVTTYLQGVYPDSPPPAPPEYYGSKPAAPPVDTRAEAIGDPGRSGTGRVVDRIPGGQAFTGGWPSAEEMTRAIAEGGRELKASGDMLGSSVEGAGSAFQQSVDAAASRMSQAADKIGAAADALAAKLANIRVKVDTDHPKVRANVGQSLAGVGGRDAY